MHCAPSDNLQRTGYTQTGEQNKSPKKIHRPCRWAGAPRDPTGTGTGTGARAGTILSNPGLSSVLVVPMPCRAPCRACRRSDAPWRAAAAHSPARTCAAHASVPDSLLRLSLPSQQLHIPPLSLSLSLTLCMLRLIRFRLDRGPPSRTRLGHGTSPADGRAHGLARRRLSAWHNGNGHIASASSGNLDKVVGSVRLGWRRHHHFRLSRWR